MIPIFITPEFVRVLLIGRGDSLRRRLDWLLARGAMPQIYCDDDTASQTVPGPQERMPAPGDFSAASIVWITGLPHEEARALADSARAAGALVNVEDVPDLCDFHTPAIVQRGRLIIAAGTGGASPAAASAVREILEQTFPDDWSDVLEELTNARAAERAAGLGMKEIAANARAILRQRGLLAEPKS